ncbi:MAG: hypothetical protein R6U52_09875 [Kosmotogaceae bacterium]
MKITPVTKRMFLIVFLSLIFSYIFTSMTVWTTDGKYLFLSRYLRINQHKRILNGENFAPDQYRFGSYYLVEHFFKHIPIRWLDEYSAEIENMLLNEDYWTEEKKELVDAYFPENEREMLKNNLTQTMNQIASTLSGENPFLKNLILNYFESTNWEVYISEPSTTLLFIGNVLPEEVETAVKLDSENNRIINGHITSRFFFCFLTMIILYRFSRHFVSAKLAVISIFVFQSLLPFTTLYFGWETFIGTTLFLSGLICIIEKRTFVLLTLLVILGSTVRPDHMVFISIIYFLYYFKSTTERKSVMKFFINTSLLLLIPVISIFIISVFIFPQADYVTDIFQLKYNLTYIWSWIYPLIFLALPILFFKGINSYYFFRKTWYWIIPFIFMNFLLAKTVEVRLFLPVIAYSIPFVISELWLSLSKISTKLTTTDT